MIRFLALILLLVMTSNVQSQFKDCQGNSCSLLPRLDAIRSAAPLLPIVRSQEAAPLLISVSSCEETRTVLLKSYCEEVPMEVQCIDSVENGMRYSYSNVGYRSRVVNETIRSNRPVVTLLTRVGTRTRNAFSTVFGKARQGLRFGSCR